MITTSCVVDLLRCGGNCIRHYSEKRSKTHTGAPPTTAARNLGWAENRRKRCLRSGRRRWPWTARPELPTATGGYACAPRGTSSAGGMADGDRSAFVSDVPYRDAIFSKVTAKWSRRRSVLASGRRRRRPVSPPSPLGVVMLGGFCPRAIPIGSSDVRGLLPPDNMRMDSCLSAGALPFRRQLTRARTRERVRPRARAHPR